LKQTKNELDALIIGRNELAKWSKRNNSNPNLSGGKLKLFKVSSDV
jgi:hypothetical protein